MSKFRVIVMWLIVTTTVFVVLATLHKSYTRPSELSYSEFIHEVKKDNVLEVTIKGNTVEGDLRKGLVPKFRTTAPTQDQDLIKLLREHNVGIAVEEKEDSLWSAALLSWFPVLLMIGILFLFLRQMQGNNKNALMFSKSRVRLTDTAQQPVTFDDVAGVDEAKEELEEIIEFLRDASKFQKLGGKIPKGVLLVGPPGTGKTLLAKAIAGEADVPFLSISGSDFVELYVGVGASRVRDLFEQGKKHAPCLIFVDELDAVGRHRGAGLGGGHDEREQTLNQLLVEMDGFESNAGVILLAATNRPDILDPALLRPGRFDRTIVVDRPDVRGRLAILAVHTRTVPLDDDVDLETLARSTPGFVGADLANLINEAALLAARHNKDRVQMIDLELAKDKVLMGTERRSLVITDSEKQTTAVHESGHAMLAWLIPGADPLHKVTIIPRGRALGVTQQIPIDDKHIYRKEDYLTRICVLLGGRVAEELILDQISSGAGDDIQRATDLARTMVCKLGMSEVLGPLAFGQHEEQIFLGKELAHRKDYSEATAIKIDDEVHAIVIQSYHRAKTLLSDNLDKMHKLIEALKVQEVLDMKAIIEILGVSPGSLSSDLRNGAVQLRPAG